MRNTTFIVVIVAALAAAGCGGSKTGAAQDASRRALALPLAVIDDAEDLRTLTPEIVKLAASDDAQMRARAALAFGRIGGAAAEPILAGLLGDADGRVRDAAAFAAGLLGDVAGKDLVPKMLELLAKEQRPEGAVALLDGLGRTAPADKAAQLARFSADGRAAVRAATLRTLGFMGQRGLEMSDDAVTAAAGALKDAEEPVRFMAAFALYRMAKPLPGPAAARDALGKAIVEELSAEVRAYAVKALARRGGLDETALLRALGDADDRVAGAGASSLALVAPDARCPLVAAGLGAAVDRVVKDPELVDGTYAHAVRALLEAAPECTGVPATKVAAARLADMLGKAPARTASGARILCLARMVGGADDLALVACDPARPWAGKRLLARRLGRGEGTPEADVTLLVEMVREPDARVATEALSALAEIPGPVSRSAILRALADDRIIVVEAALDALSIHKERYRREGPAAPPAAEADVLEAIEAVVDRFLPFPHAHAPLLSAASTLRALGDPAAEPILARLAADPRPVVRAAALEAYAGIAGLTPPATLSPLSPARPVSHDKKAELRVARLKATVDTTRGAFIVQLDPATAPATVGSFVELAENGFFDGTEIHRVVPNFVVQAGDPTGTGLGDPGYSLTCELSPLPYERGTMGMALSGKDTGGSQFFVTLSRQPHLDGNYTVFGKVVSGMDVVDLIEEGDLIERVRIAKE
ncbi:MAG: peptidylprolyl isomerase [Deltaproteobacteria bacterium]|nr:peptidylprolyl isomerase [Deltaproteobacteria bacterium]